MINHSMLSNDARLSFQALPDVQATVFDDDRGGLIIRESDGNSLVLEGETTNIDPTLNGAVNDSYTIQLTSQPTSDVTVTLANDNQLVLSSNSLTFTSLNWNIPQTVTIAAVNDSVIEKRMTSSITHTLSSADCRV